MPARAADSSPAGRYRTAVRLTAQIASVVATWGRLKVNGGVISPDPALGHAANFLYMLTGNRPDATSVRALDVALTLHADHELNASTFAGRVAAATLTDVYSSVVAAIGALKGPLHGGANADVMRLLLELGETATPDRVDQVIRGKLARKERDYATELELQWFIQEQVQEEDNASTAVDQLELAGDSKAALLMLDGQFGQRAGTE